ncbi:hypothetical protein RHSP_22544 [Rhizobium freirei PRF 81]|uniref:YcxB-like protein domain-containing protein n=1 Tax=Rhizobium freirei PRF 81 TaxID=363754 RepID=N6UUG9_9HYPH|nr:hypothetical protein [Rhizobium freirei]ENN84426.1 hypothetical protein RHSP_22544 [Rhizobium freirei PRF 81]
MTNGSEDHDSVIVSFQRQPDEHVAVMLRAGRRLAGRSPQKAQNEVGWFFISAIAVGAGLPVLFYLLRRYVYIPVFGLSPSIHEADIAIIWLVPSLMIYALILVYARWAMRRRLVVMRSRIRPNVAITVTANTEGASWASTNTTIWLGWSEVINIRRVDRRIEFDLESFVTYIPASAFSDQREQDAAFARILGFWRAANPVQP